MSYEESGRGSAGCAAGHGNRVACSVRKPVSSKAWLLGDAGGDLVGDRRADQPRSVAGRAVTVFPQCRGHSKKLIDPCGMKPAPASAGFYVRSVAS